MAKDRLYALGSNSHGQLGTGDRDDVDVATPCRLILPKIGEPSDSGVAAAAIAAGSCLPLESTSDLPSPVLKIVAGGNHTLVLLQNGAVYAAGNPEALGEAAASASLGDDAAAAAASFRQVAWSGDDGEVVDTFTDISATWAASFFVVSPRRQGSSGGRLGRIYACGRGERGELGLGKDVVATKEPRWLLTFGLDQSSRTPDRSCQDVVQIPGGLTGIWSGVSHSVACFDNPLQTYGWGACRKGQLGEQVKGDKMIWKPRRVVHGDGSASGEVNLLSPVALGRDFSLLSCAPEQQGQHQSRWRFLGGNSFLDSNRDDLKESLAGSDIPNSGQEAIDTCEMPLASWSNLYFLNESTREVKALGRNDHGQLLPKMLPGLSMMAAGSEHCVGLTAQEKIVAWGWGEHGNCGRRDDETGHGWNVLSLPISSSYDVVGIGAGCATTFVCTHEP